MCETKNLSVREKIVMLIFSDITNGNQLYVNTGISRSAYSELRKGVRKIDNLTLETVEKLVKYYDELAIENKIEIDDDLLVKHAKPEPNIEKTILEDDSEIERVKTRK